MVVFLLGTVAGIGTQRSLTTVSAGLQEDGHVPCIGVKGIPAAPLYLSHGKLPKKGAGALLAEAAFACQTSSEGWGQACLELLQEFLGGSFRVGALLSQQF